MTPIPSTSERINHYNRQPGHTTAVELGKDNQPWHTVTDEDGVLIDWFPTEEPVTDQPPAQSKRRK